MSRPERIAPPELFYDDKCVKLASTSNDPRTLRRRSRTQGLSYPTAPFTLRLLSLGVFIPCREAGKYTGNSRIIAIQTAMAERCIELLNFTDDGPKLILDIGCGSGLSGGKWADQKASRSCHHDGGTLLLYLALALAVVLTCLQMS